MLLAPLLLTFSLNNQSMSTLTVPGLGTFPAYSGNKRAINDPASVTSAHNGPLPPGRYYIVDRQDRPSVGRYLIDLAHLVLGEDRQTWFSLYRDDGTIDDRTTVNGHPRSSFRLHPSGYFRLSEGCLTLQSRHDFQRIRAFLLIHGATDPVPQTTLHSYGMVEIK